MSIRGDGFHRQRETGLFPHLQSPIVLPLLTYTPATPATTSSTLTPQPVTATSLAIPLATTLVVVDSVGVLFVDRFGGDGNAGLLDERRGRGWRPRTGQQPLLLLRQSDGHLRAPQVLGGFGRSWRFRRSRWLAQRSGVPVDPGVPEVRSGFVDLDGGGGGRGAGRFHGRRRLQGIFFRFLFFNCCVTKTRKENERVRIEIDFFSRWSMEQYTRSEGLSDLLGKCLNK